MHVRCTRLCRTDLSEIDSATFAGIDCCCGFLCSLPQYETERILETHLESLGGAVERGVTVTKLDLDDNGVLAELVRGDGAIETVHAGVVIGAGGSHSVTRDSMDLSLEGGTYQGHFLVADIAMQTSLPRDETSFFFGPAGLLLLAPLPGGRWLSFQDLEESVETVSAEEVVARIELRLGGRWRPADVAWFSPFRMHRRIVSRLTDGRCFLIGDATHLSSPFGGEGLNSGLHDGYDLAWKLALVLSGHARPWLLDDYALERRIADRHVLEVSDEVHRAVVGIADTVRQGREVPTENVDPVAAALQRNARAMIDVDYTGSPLVIDHAPNGAGMAEPHPGQRYPDWTRFGGTSHRVLVFGPATDAERLAQLGRRWHKRVEISHNRDVNPVRAGVGTGGVVLIRPDGHIGFRFPSADAEAIAALDRHLSSYLIPDPAMGPV